MNTRKPMATRNSDRPGWNSWKPASGKELFCIVGSLIIMSGISCVVLARIMS